MANRLIAPLLEQMTLRDFFAAQALSGWLASYGADAGHPAKDDEYGILRDAEIRCAALAEASYRLADALLAARELDPDRLSV